MRQQYEVEQELLPGSLHSASLLASFLSHELSNHCLEAAFICPVQDEILQLLSAISWEESHMMEQLKNVN